MPFLAPLAAPLIMGGASIGSGLLAGRRSGEEKRALASQSRLTDIQTKAAGEGLDYARQFQPFAMDFLRRGGSGLGGAMDYWRRILSGRDQATSLLSPEISQITEGYRGARESSRTLNPRGGGSSAFTRNIDEAVIPGQIGNLLATARPQAASNVGSIGEALLQLANSTGTTAGNFLRGTGGGAGQGILNYGLNRTGQQYDIGSGVGSVLSSRPLTTWSTNR